MSYFTKLIFPGGIYNKKYCKFLKWSFLSNVLVSIESAMATNNMLNAIGSEDTTDYRTLNYIGKDIIGQMGGILYMAKMSEKADGQPKQFLIYSHIIQQSSYMLMASTSMADPYLFLPIAGFANIFSNISFTGYGAINAKCIQEMSRNNMGEMYAKITTVNTTASSVGLLIGVGLCTLVPDDTTRLGIMPFIGLARVYSFNKAIEDLI